MREIMINQATSCVLKELVCKFIPEMFGKEIEKATSSIYSLQNVFIRKVKILKAGKFDLGKLMENLIATKPGIQRITGITVFDTREMKSYDPLPDLEGRKFSVQGLLGKELCSSAFADGTLVIFRLAPQDYHRFHLPVSGTIEQFVNIPGCLFTVNPIAVNSKYCNVFTENKRVVSIISTVDFGKVAFVAIGATMVGSINFTKKKGDYVKKGDEFGYFSFGGSTVICVFEKNSIAIDEDLLSNSTRSLETLVTVGMRLGVSTRKLS